MNEIKQRIQDMKEEINKALKNPKINTTVISLLNRVEQPENIEVGAEDRV
jgi:hypothetical protein